MSVSRTYRIEFEVNKMVASFRDTTQRPLPLSHFKLHRAQYIVDRNFQREAVWTTKMEQYLIDSILKNYDVPKVYVQVLPNGEYSIVDGQQRLNAVWRFLNDDFSLRKEYSGDLGGKRYSELSMEDKIKFDSFNLTQVELRNYSDDEVRDLYRRLQSGKPLNTAEILNAYHGKIVLTMREIADHLFFKEIVTVRATRYRYYHITAQLMLLESEGLSDIAPSYVYEFFDDNPDLEVNSELARKVRRVLTYLRNTFGSRTMELGKPSWIITTYVLVSHLLDNYAMNGRESQLKTFFIKFYQDVLNSTSSGDEELINFNFAISRGTTGKSSIQIRHRTILSRFLGYAKDLVPKDPQREYTREERIAVFRRDGGKCKSCGKELSMDNFHVHHIKQWSEGGQTTLENAKLLCPDCHIEEHRKGLK